MDVEYYITNKCNLNCKGCAAFAPLVKEDNSKPLKQIEKDFKKLHELIGEKIRTLTIMGGEPLLHPDINNVVTYISKLFKNSEIRMVTNGILLPKMNDEFFNILKIHLSELCVTVYPTNTDYEKIFKLLDDRQIKYKKYGVKNLFYHQYLKEEYEDPKDCWYRNLYVLKDNKIYTCTEIAFFNYFEEEFKGQHSLKLTEDDYIDLDKINSFEELEEAKKKIPPFCGYCMGNDKKMTKWGTSKKDINEWIKNT